MQITAARVKELRERTGAGMMDCKQALQEAAGDIEAAIEAMRKSGLARAAKKAGRIAAEGIILVKQAADGSVAIILELNCETDFVAKDEHFLAFANALMDTALANAAANAAVSVEALSALTVAGGDQTVEETRLQLVSRIGENISIRRLERLAGDHQLGLYLHGMRIGVMVEVAGGAAALARDLAMHIAASRPLCIAKADVPQALLDKEKAIYTAQAEESGKPPAIIEKMVGGRLRKYLEEITLLGQPFVKDPEQTVAQLLAANNAEVKRFIRYEVGEGIEKKTDNFAAEVMAQAGISA